MAYRSTLKKNQKELVNIIDESVISNKNMEEMVQLLKDSSKFELGGPVGGIGHKVSW